MVYCLVTANVITWTDVDFSLVRFCGIQQSNFTASALDIILRDKTENNSRITGISPRAQCVKGDDLYQRKTDMHSGYGILNVIWMSA